MATSSIAQLPSATSENPPPPSSPAFNSILSEASNDLFEILDVSRGRKALIVDPSIAPLLNNILQEGGSKQLKDSGVLHFLELKEGSLESLMMGEVPENVIFLVRPHLSLMRIIAMQIKSFVRLGVRSQFKVCFVPSQSTICMHLLEEHIDNAEIWLRIGFIEYKIGFVPYDSDILTLEMNNIFKQCYVDGDLSCLDTIAHGLLKLQASYGIIPNIKSKGVGAKKVLQKMLHKRVEESLTSEKDSNNSVAMQMKEEASMRSEIDTLVILDRETDLVSLFVTPLTYEGLVDDTFGINNCRIKVESSILGNEEADLLAGPGANKATTSATAKPINPSEKITMVLNYNDSIYGEIRNLSIERLGSYMQEKAIHIRERYAAFKGNKDASLAEIHEFVKKIPKLTKDFKSLNQHIHIAEKLKQRTDTREFRDRWQGERAMLEGESYLDQIDELLCMDVERSQLYPILKLLCLQSVTSGGIRGNRLDSLKKTIIQTYGMQCLFTFVNLEKSGLIRRKDNLLVVETTSVWQTLRKILRLIDDRINMSKPDDISFVAAGYAPLLVRLVQYLCHQNSSANPSLMEALKLLPGPFLEFVQSSKPEELADILSRHSSGEIVGGAALPSIGSTSIMNAVTSAASELSIGSRFKRESSEGPSVPPRFLSASEETTATKKVMMVMVIGGLSFLEISALRFLSSDASFPYRIVMATTKVVNGESFLSALE